MAAPFTLRVFRGDRLLRAEEFTRDLVKIGKLASAHLVLDDEQVARIHAVIEVAQDGRMSIIDMGSTWGTLVNGRRITKGPLQGGDQIAIGGLRIEVVAEAPAAAPRPEMRTAPAPEAVRPAAQAPLAAAPAAVPAPELELEETTGAEQLRAAPTPEAAQAPEPDLPPAPRAEPPPEEEPAPAPAPRPAAAPRPVAIASVADPDGTGVELRLLWGDVLLEASTFVKPARPVTVGEAAGSDFQVEGVELPRQPYPILRFQDGEYRFLFAKGMHGGVERAGRVTAIGQLVKERQALPDDGGDGAYAVVVPTDGAVRAEIGSSLRFEARYRTPPKPAVVPWWERLDYRYLNLFLILFFLQSGFMVAAANWPQNVDTVADDLFKNPSRMAKFIIQPPEPQKKQNPALDKLAQELKGQEPGEMAEKHKGTEGQMGKKDAPKTTGRSAPKAIDPNAKELVKNSGLLAVLGRGKGASGGLSTIFGQGGLGGDLKGAVGNMFGPVVGDSQGIGGLGIKGTGTGGGGQGETIGIGAVGTKGRGGGLGGYGSGVGGLGRKSDRDVAIDTTNVKILGAIDPELIRKVIRENASQVRYCYEQELTLNPKLEGKVAVQWQIDADGRASGCVVHSDTTLLNDKVQRCIMSRIVTWQFPKPKGGGIAIVKYPWILRTSGG
ncbi:MAG: adventurous gliding motility protein GltG [Deltaproteobacteria bacterium]|nr:adventurous gliding motility protein GltG [Deltaproteobacteria bacterium]